MLVRRCENKIRNYSRYNISYRKYNSNQSALKQLLFDFSIIKFFYLKNNLRYLHNVVEDAVFSFLEIKNITKVVLMPNISLNYLIRESSITNAVMYNNISIETAKIYLSIRDYEFSLNDSQILEDVCSNLDVFFFCYIMTVRDSYKSKNISKKDKLELCRNAFKTPVIPLKMFFPLLYSKKKNFLLLLVVKILPYRLNILVVNLYHKLKSV